ncbi:MAG: hypothetical protein AAF497_19730 [Planctomycetota bacterium]
MALDVYMVDSVGRDPAAGFPSCSIVDRDHEFIFHGAGIDIDNCYPFLRRMIDFYADAQYGCDVLDSLIAEIDDVMQKISSVKSAVDTMQLFRDVCLAARESGKSLILFCD